MNATRATTAQAAALAGARQVVADYVALTKPKVQSLLLFTTVCAMFVAGTPSAWLVLATVIGGYLSAGGSGAINHWYDRDIDVADEPHRRPARRQRARLAARGADVRPACSASPSVVWLARARQPARRRRSRSSGFVGYAVGYTMLLKRHTWQNIVWGGAAGAVPPLVGWAAVDGRLTGMARLPVRHRLLLDAAALLGAQPADEGRVREGRRPDAAGRARRGRDAPPDPALHGAALRGDAAAVLRRRPQRVLPRRVARPRRRLHRALASSCAAAPTARSALRVYLFSLGYLAALFAAMVADVHLF